MPKFLGDESECNHDVDHDDATAHAYTLGCDWGTDTTVFCLVCMEQIGPSILECKCGASWQEGLFNGCPWCNQTIWYVVHSLEERG
jgi:hypothetical protein